MAAPILPVTKKILFSPVLPVLLVLVTVGLFLGNVVVRILLGSDELHTGVGVCLLLSATLTVLALVARRFLAGLLYAIPLVLLFALPHSVVVNLHRFAVMKKFEMKRADFEHCAETAKPTDQGKIAVCEVHDFMMGAYIEAIIYDSSGQIALPDKSNTWIQVSNTLVAAVPFGIMGYEAEKISGDFYEVTFSGDMNIKP
jgi:hypothetical protein